MSTNIRKRSSPKALAYCVAVSCALALPAVRASAWGNEGHRIVARIAEAHLTEGARQQMIALKLLTNDSYLADCAASHLSIATFRDQFVCVATWADAVRRTTFQETYNWHFVDISLKFNDYDHGRDCDANSPKGDCGLAALPRLQSILSGAIVDPQITRGQALKFIIHIVGDLHQPLHTVKEDIGGNSVIVTYFNFHTTKTQPSLHHVWDTNMIQSRLAQLNENEEQYALMLGREITAGDVAKYETGTPETWLLDAHARASSHAYGKLPKRKTREPDGHAYLKLAKLYYGESLPVINEQLKMAGIRLAKILNAAFN